MNINLVNNITASHLSKMRASRDTANEWKRALNKALYEQANPYQKHAMNNCLF